MTTMNKPVDHMFRAGQISGKAMKRLSAQHGGVAPSKGAKTHGRMADFDGKGTRDQGGVRNPGIINKNEINESRFQSTGREAHAGGLPSRGGRVHGAQINPVTSNGINMPMRQKPDWPREGSRAAGQNREGAPRRMSAQTGRIPPQGGQYGGGGQDTQ